MASIFIVAARGGSLPLCNQQIRLWSGAERERERGVERGEVPLEPVGIGLDITSEEGLVMVGLMVALLTLLLPLCSEFATMPPSVIPAMRLREEWNRAERRARWR